MDNLQQLQQMADQQLKRLGSALELANSVINALPSEAKAAIPHAKADIEAIKKGLSNGDSSRISDLLKKYADITTK